MVILRTQTNHLNKTRVMMINKCDWLELLNDNDHFHLGADVDINSGTTLAKPDIFI